MGMPWSKKSDRSEPECNIHIEIELNKASLSLVGARRAAAIQLASKFGRGMEM
jgi:hypothetical protein